MYDSKKTIREIALLWQQDKKCIDKMFKGLK